jgi:hypothetical protein
MDSSLSSFASAMRISTLPTSSSSLASVVDVDILLLEKVERTVHHAWEVRRLYEQGKWIERANVAATECGGNVASGVACVVACLAWCYTTRTSNPLFSPNLPSWSESREPGQYRYREASDNFHS